MIFPVSTDLISQFIKYFDISTHLEQVPWDAIRSCGLIVFNVEQEFLDPCSTNFDGVQGVSVEGDRTFWEFGSSVEKILEKNMFA